MILLHIDYDVVECFSDEIMKHANRVNRVLYIDFFTFKMNGSYLPCVYISGR